MKELVVNLMKAARLEAEMTGTQVSPELENQLKLWGAGIFRLVVMGEIKKGKSSFINAMLGVKDLVPVSSNVATSTIFKIRYAKERGYRVYFSLESGKKTLDINEHDLAKYGTEDGNPGNVEKVDFIEVLCPAPLLRSGIVIIDTPGLGGLFKAHKQITYQYVPRADAVFFVTDSVESPIGALEIEYLKEILKITPNLYFVQTKTSAVDEEACMARKKNNISILSKALNIPEQKIPYFLLDAELRFASQEDRDKEILALSGYPQLMAYINDVLQPNQQRILAARALLRMRPVFNHLHELIKERESVLQADTAEKRARCKEENEKKQAEYREWKENTLPKISSKLQKGLNDLGFFAREKCSCLRPMGEVQGQLEEFIKQASSVKEMAKVVENLNAKLSEYVTQTTQEIIQELRTRASCLLSEIAGYGGASEKMELSTQVRGDSQTYNLRELTITENSTLVENIKTGVLGAVRGGWMASVVGGAIGSVIPVVGTLIGSSIGMLIAGGWGGFEAMKSKEKNDLRMAQSELSRQISNNLSEIFNKLQQGIDRLLSDIRNEVQEKLTQFIKTREGELKNQMKELQNRAQMSAEEQKKQTMQLQARRALLDSIEREIKAHFEMMEKKGVKA